MKTLFYLLPLLFCHLPLAQGAAVFVLPNNARATNLTVVGATFSSVTNTGGTFTGATITGSLTGTNAVLTTPSIVGGTNTGSLITGATITGSLTGTNAVLTTPGLVGASLTGTNTATRLGFGTGSPQSTLANTASIMGGAFTANTNSLLWETTNNDYAAVLSSYATSGANYGLRLHSYSSAQTDFLWAASSGPGVGNIHSVLTANGHLGLGTTTPANLLTLKDTTNGAPYVRILNGAGTLQGFFGTASGLITGVSTNYLTVRGETGLVLSGQGNSYDMLLTGGKVGIGLVSSPQYVLDLNGSLCARGTNPIYFGGTLGAADATSYAREVSAGILQLRGTSRLELYGNTVAGSASGVTPLAALHASGSGSALIFVANSQGNSPTAPLLAAAINGTNVFQVSSNATVGVRGTITAPGTTGGQTINRPLGSINLAAGATSAVVTNSCVISATASVVFLQVGSNDATCKSAAVVVGSGSFTVYPDAAPTGETVIFFEVKTAL